MRLAPRDPKASKGLYTARVANVPSEHFETVLDNLQRVRNWTLQIRNDELNSLGAEIGERRIEKWEQIATEVRLRKTLILAAADDLGQAVKQLDNRYNISLQSYEIGDKGPWPKSIKKQEPSAGATPSKLSAPSEADKIKRDAEITPDATAVDGDAVSQATGCDTATGTVKANVLVMAATDVFAEKAQRTLTDRANILIGIGVAVAVIALMCLVGGAVWILRQETDRLFSIETGVMELTHHPNHYLGLIILQRITASGLLLGAVYFLVMIARALLHEAMVLYGRRHSLRFGRLYVYSKLGHVNYEEMEKAFGWSSEHRSAFADIRGDKISKSIVQTIADVAKEVSRSTASAVAEVAKTKTGRD